MNPPLDYVAHIQFLLRKGAWVPWNMSLRSYHAPFRNISVGLDPSDLSLWHNDLYYNCYFVDTFPKPQDDDAPVDYVCSEADFPETLKKIYNALETRSGNWEPAIGAVDAATYAYLKDVLPGVVRMNAKPTSEDLTLGVLCREHKVHERCLESERKT